MLGAVKKNSTANFDETSHKNAKSYKGGYEGEKTGWVISCYFLRYAVVKA